MNNDEVKKLYSALIGKGYSTDDLGDEKTFQSMMSDKANRKELYDRVSINGDFRIGDYDRYESRLTGANKVPAEDLLNPKWKEQSYSPNPEILKSGYLPKSEPTQQPVKPSVERPMAEQQLGDPEGIKFEEDYVEGFGEGFKQGWQGLKEGAKFFAGETANLVTGSSLDDKRALETFNRLQQEGKTDYINKSGNTYVADKSMNEDLKLIRDAIQEAGGDMDKAKRILSERAADKSWGDSMMESAKEGMNAMKPTKGFGAWVGNLVPQMIPSAAAIALSFVTKNPKYAQLVGGIGMGGMTASTAGQSMKEARDAGATNGEVWAVGIADGVIEYATEKLPFDNYTRKLFNGVKHKVGGEMAEAANYVSSPGRAELEELLTKANKKLGGRLFNGKNVKDYLASMAEEGLSEFTAEALQTITPMIYENPENYPVLTDILSSGWEGAKAGLFMGSVLGGASKIAEHRQQRARRKEQGYVDVAQVHMGKNDEVVEIVGFDNKTGDYQVLHDGKVRVVKRDDVVESHRFTFDEFDNAELDMEAGESYQNGYSLKTPQEMTDAKNMYECQRARLAEQLGVEPDVLDDEIGDPINFIKEQRMLDADDSILQSVLDYANAKSTLDGMKQRVSDDIESRVAMSNEQIDQRTNRNDGMVHPATMQLNDRAVHIIDGNIVMTDDGTMVDSRRSDATIIIRDAATGKVEFAAPEAILNVQEPIYAAEEQIRQQFMQEYENKASGRINAWNVGDSYVLTDGQGQQMKVTIVANEQGMIENPDGTVNLSMNGQILAMPKDQVQQMLDNTNMSRVAGFTATNEAKEVEDEFATPSYDYDYRVSLQAGGKNVSGRIAEITADGDIILDELSSSINGKRSPKLTQSELNDMVVSVQDADGNLVWQREDLATEAAENVTKGAEGVPENTENVPENAENVQNNGRKSDEAGERTDNNGIVLKDDGSPDLAASGALNALGFLRERYKEEAKVQRKIETTRDYYGKELEKVQKVLDKAQQEFDDAPFGFEDKAEAKLKQAQQGYDAVKREVDLWTELYNMLIADRVKANSEVVSEIEDMGEPLNGEELAAMMLINGQIHLLREDYLRETGYSNQEANKLFGLFRSKENGGVTVEQAGEMVMLADNEDGTHFFDEADANAGRNAVLEVLSLVHTPSDLRDYIKNRREQQAQRELEAEREYYENMIERDFHMTLEEYEDYVYLLSKENPFEDIDVAEIDAIFAEAANEYEEFLKQQEYEQGRTDESIEGGNDVLLEERADDSPGTEEGEGSRETEGAGSGTAGKDGTSSGYDGGRNNERGGQGTDENTGRRQQNNLSEEAGENKITPIGESDFGFVYDQFVGDAQGAIRHLSMMQDGEAIGALRHDEIGDIDLVWGKAGTKKSDGYGLSKLVKFHPEVLENLQGIIGGMKVTKRSDNRVQLEDDNYQAAVRLTWNGDKKIWLLTAFKKKETSEPTNSSTDVVSNQKGKSDDTATRQSSDVSESKDSKNSLNISEIEENNQPSAKNNVKRDEKSGVKPAEQMGAQPTVQAQIDAAEAETDTNPTDAQKEAGNYKKGHVQVGTFDISIEQPKGSVRSGVDADGKKWETKMQNTYGYIRGTEGVDGDHIDVFLANDVDAWNGRKVFVVDQYNEDGSFDEHKVMLGFNEQEEAEDAYFANYDKDWPKKHKTVVTAVNLEYFEKWIQSSHRKTKAFAEYKNVKVIRTDHQGNPVNADDTLEQKKRQAINEGGLILTLESAAGNTINGLSSESKDNKSAAEKQVDGTKSSEAYSITPAQYTTKKGKVLDMQLVTPNVELSKDEFRSINALVKSLKGWFDAKQRGFMMRSEEDARKLVEHALSVVDKHDSPVNDTIEYRYRLTIRPFSIGTQPDGHLRHEDDGSPYGVVVYDHPLTRQEAENFSLTPLTEAKELEGKNFEVPFGKGVLKYQVRSVDENGRVKFLINGEHERSLPYYRFLDEIGDKAKELAEEAHHDATEKQHAREKSSAEIEAAWKKRIDGYIKEHYPAISERSENGMAQRIASYKDKVLTEMRDNAELEITAMKEEEGVFGERVPVVSGEFPKGLPEHKVVTKKQKGGKSTVAENVYVAMVNGDLYVKRYVRGEDLKNISVRIPGAKKYDFNEIKYRLELGIGTSTDAVRLMGDAIDELYKRGDFQESIFEKAERIAKEFEERTKKQAEAAQETHHEVYPISTSSRWGKVYQWSVGSFKDAVDFLMNKKDGMLKGVFYRDEIGEIGVGWGVAPNDFNGRGLSHIVRKHVNKLHDFSDVDEMIRVVEDVINHGVVRKDKDDSYAIENDTYRVVVVKDEDGAWVLSAFDYVNSKKEKAKRKDTAALGTPGQSNVEAGAVTSNLSRNKDNELASEKQLLNENEIRESPFSEIMKDGAMAYINGNINFATSVAYQQIYNYVWNRSENNQSYSTGRSAAQRITTVDEASGRRGGLNGVQTGRMAGETDQPGGSQNSKRVGVLSDRAGSDTAVRGEISADGGLSSGDTGRKGGSRTGSKGDNVRKPESERGSSGTVGESVEEGGDSSNRGNIESCKDELKALLLEYEKASKKGLSLSVIGMNAEQIEIAGKILVAGVKLGYAYLKAGVIKFEHWNKAMHNDLALPFATSMHLSNAEIDVFIGDMWEYPYKVDGETRLLREWASIIGKAELRKKVGESLEEKRKAQAAAEPVAVKVCDRNNIAETLPFLLPQQQEDVMKAETQFFDDSHNDRDHAFGKGYMFTNGTGTGKTYTGLGIVKRFIKQGKGRILILTPSQTKVKDWVDDAKNLGIELNDLDAVAKAKKDGATATTEKGEGAVITTYANFRQNKALLEDLFDLIVYDESHRLLENKDGIGTAGSLQHYKLSNRNKNYSYLRLQEINPVWNDYQAKIEEFDAEREKLIERLKKEYGIANELALGQRGGLPPALNGNWTGDMERKFPELAKLRNEVNTLGAKYEKEIKPKLEEEAKANMKHTKVVFLSATPFNTRENLDYAEGYIFSYPENDRQVGYANQSPRSQFYLEHFGAGYRWRYNRLESSSSNAAAVSKQEVEFSDYLQHALQTMSGRVIDSPYDYSRDFPTVTMEKAETFNSAMEELSRDEATSSGYREVMGDYNYTSALFESMKVSQIIPRLKAHLERGRKVVIFHRRVDSREPLRLPFAAIFAESARLAEKESDAQEKAEKKKRIASLKRKYTDLLAWEQGLDLRMPREQLADAFGKDDVLFFSGKEGEKAKKKAVKDFNSDTSGKNIMVIQEASGKEGISLHDTTGVHQRVLVTLALPQSPITALQIEGRIYRIGNKSNAIFEYPLLGLNAEMMLFGQKFNEQVSTTENLALGSQARNLRESFARGVEEHSGNVDIDGQGVGGKELDAPSVTETDAFDRAVLDYYTNQKLAGRRDSREGQDYYPTPEPLGYMMNQWGQIGEGESVLEPSAGHGAIARYVPKENLLTAVEPSQRLFSKLQIKAGGNGRKFENDVFENYNVVNKHDVVLMNPPFGVGGRMAVDHVAKAFQHLDEGGRVVAIIPRGSTDKKFEKWYEGQKDAVLTAEIGLPDITFERAGTSVNCRVVVIDKVTNKDLRGDAASRAVHVDLSGMHFDKIEDFFEEIRDIRVPERTIDYKAKMKKKATPVARELRGMKGIKKVELNEDRIFVDGRGVWASLQWGDWQGDALTRHLANEYVRFRKSEEYAADRENNIQIEVYGELKELCCKLAGLTEDEMQRYIERSGKDADEDLYREDDDLEEVNERFNEQLESLTEENAQGVILDLGRPGDILLSAGLSDREIRLYGNKVMKKIRKHGFAISSIKNLPVAINHPIAVFNNYGNEMNRAILTELKTPQGNVLATIEWGKGTDAELNIVTSVFGKGKENVIGWINKGYATYISKEKALDYLRIPAPIAGAQDSQELSSATKIVKEFENPSIDGEDLYREVTDDSELAWLENQPTVKAYRAMQVIDGRLYSPMASGKKKNLGAGYGLNKWDVATEMAFNVTDEMLEEVEKLNQSDKRGYVEVIPGKLRFVKESKTGNASLKFHLVTDETDVWAAYNPYNHNSDSMLNDQFKAAYRRGNIVVVEAEVPVGDLESGYQAPYSKDAVGKTEWKSGDVAAQFPDEMKRTVYLSRYTKPVRVLSNAEVAKWIGDRLRKAEQLTGKPITLYEASFHPEVKRLLEADGFTFVPVEQPKGKVSKVLEGHPDYMSDDKIAQINEALSQEDSWLQRGGDGSFSDEELSYENDPIAKWLGESKRSEKQKHAYAEKARTRMANRVNELAEQLHLDNVEVVTDVSTLEGRKARAKGWFSPKTGKIVVVIPNHKSIADVEQTVLHEAVAHYGLRKLFGKHFDDFLWNVYNNASEDVRRKIAGLAAKRGWDFPKATEEYLASLAEDTDFENAANSGWFSKIKFFFLKMLAKAGVKLDVELGDNELRYILWRSYENMAEPGRYRGVIEQAADIAKQYELGVGNYANGSSGQQHVADEMLLREDDVDVYAKAYVDELKRLTKNSPAIHLLQSEEDINKLPYDGYTKRALRKKLEDMQCDGVYDNDVKAVFLFPAHMNSLREMYLSLWHETAHYASRNIPLSEAEKEACLEYLKDKYKKRYRDLIQHYPVHKWNEEGVAFLFEKIIDKFGAEKILSSEFGGNEIISDVFSKITIFLKDGEYNRFRQSSRRGRGSRLSKTERGGDRRGWDESIQAFERRRDGRTYKEDSSNEQAEDALNKIGYERESEERSRRNNQRNSKTSGEERSLRVQQDEKILSGGEDIFYREGDGGTSGADGASGGEVGAVRSATELYEEGVANTLWNRLKEGWVDYLRSAQQLQEAIEKAAGEKIADFENVYLHALHKSSVDNREWMAMMKKYVEPLNDVIHEITHGLKATFRGGKITLDVIETYLNCKHGLERNDKFAMRDAEERVKVRIAKADKALAEELRDAEKLRNRDLRKLDRKRMDGRVDETAYRQAVEAVKAEYEKDVKQAQDMRDKQVAKIEKKLNEYYKENRERDYSGLTEIFDPKVKGVRKGLTVEELERLAQAYVDDFEAAVGAHFVGKLWDKVREMNRFSLRKSYETGLISRDSYKRTLDMFSYYVPLRGFDGEKAADVYDYITEGTISVNEVLKHAKGRTSRAANLIATMMNMGNSAITQGNKNQVKNRLLNLANNHDTGGLLTVSNQWYEKVGEDEWMPAQEPSFKEGMTAEEMRSVVEDYEERMKEREALGEVKRMKNGVHLNVRLDSKRKEYEHGVKVKRNGTEYVVWVNGNPKAAQAINGLLNPEMKHGFVLDNLRRLGRFVSKNVTAFNPEFLLRNIKRDVLSASMVGYSKYGADYVKRFEWHVKNNVSMVDVKGARAGKFSGIYDLYHRYEKGALDMSVQRERWFKEFIENGGETGYSQVWSIEDYQREIKKQMKRHRADSQTMQAVAAVGAGVEFLNRGVENVCRFAAYCASRESGMNVLESVRDAKEASVNFNKKGSGALGNAGAKALFMFLNPSVQGFVQQLVLTKKYPKRMLPVLGAQIALGAIAVLLAQWVGDDDEDEDDYFNLNSHVRRSNFILRVGDHEYLRWDLPPDLRPWYGLGEIGASALAGKMKYENVPLAVLTNFSQMLPLDPVNDKALVNDDENLMKGVFKNILRGTGVGSWADAYLFDEDFMGRQITGATEWNKLDPEWKRAGRNTSGLMIYLSKLANEATGGDDATSGWLNFNPSKLEYALKGTLGGWVDFPVSFCKGCEAFFSDDPDEKLDTRNYPIIGDTYIRTDNSRMRHTQVRSAYQWYKHEHDVFEHKLKTYNREVYEGGLMEYAEKVKNLYESAAYYRFLLVDGYMKEVNSVYSAMKQAEDEKERKDLEAYVDYLKAEMVKKLEQKEAEDGGMADAEETTGK